MHRASEELRLRHGFQMRAYTATQFRRRLASVSLLEVDDTYDFRCDVGHPFALNYEMAYGVFAVYHSRPLFDYYTLRDVDSESARRVYGVTLRCQKKIESYLKPPNCLSMRFSSRAYFRRTHISHMRTMNEENMEGGSLIILHNEIAQDWLI